MKLQQNDMINNISISVGFCASLKALKKLTQNGFWTTVRLNPFFPIYPDGYFTDPNFDRENMPEPFNMPRQTLPEIYWQTGSIDVIRTSVIESGSMTGNEIRPFIVEQEHAIDIDNFESFTKAEQIISSTECITPPIIEY